MLGIACAVTGQQHTYLYGDTHCISQHKFKTDAVHQFQTTSDSAYLDKYETERPGDTNVVPSHTEVATWNEESPHNDADKGKKFKEPKPVTNTKCFTQYNQGLPTSIPRIQVEKA